ncbi:MAG: hypothetical protein ABWJ97_01775 [Thermoproteus sp.]
MDFQTAMRSLYRGYLYQLVLILALVLLAVVILLSAALQPMGRGAGPVALVVASAVLVIALLIAVVVVFFLFIFRGYNALYRLGFRWAWWLAWGTIVLFVIVFAGLAVIVAYYSYIFMGPGRLPPSALSNPYSLLASSAPLLGYSAVVIIFSLIISIARVILLRDLYNYTKIDGFRTAYILYIIALVLSFIPLASLIGTVLAFVEYIVEMLAYRDAAARPPAPQTQQTS